MASETLLVSAMASNPLIVRIGSRTTVCGDLLVLGPGGESHPYAADCKCIPASLGVLTIFLAMQRLQMGRSNPSLRGVRIPRAPSRPSLGPMLIRVHHRIASADFEWTRQDFLPPIIAINPSLQPLRDLFFRPESPLQPSCLSHLRSVCAMCQGARFLPFPDCSTDLPFGNPQGQ